MEPKIVDSNLPNKVDLRRPRDNEFMSKLNVAQMQ